jgi:hypothetical protein
MTAEVVTHLGPALSELYVPLCASWPQGALLAQNY